ncbi:MAG TPA: 2-C-methyl-D-erythritol 4-phosphate cytidylyltransferase [Longimicrobium sp.]
MSSASSAEPRAAAVVVAGGSGRRVGGPVRKQYLALAGELILLRAVRPFLDHPRIRHTVVVIPPDDADDPPGWLSHLPITLVPGGAERGDSVWNGLSALPDDVDLVLIHDGARPFVSQGVIDRVLDACRDAGAVAAVPVTDTIKEVDDAGTITGTPERGRLWQAQTPQGFPRAGIVRAYELARAEGVAATDDAALYERYAGPVRVVMGSYRNLKVTRRADLAVAEALALAPEAGESE